MGECDGRPEPFFSRFSCPQEAATADARRGRRRQHEGGWTAVDPALIKEEMMKEAREVRRGGGRSGGGRGHEQMATLLGGAGHDVQPIDAEAMMRAMRQQMGR
jgi:hypothetical protein